MRDGEIVMSPSHITNESDIIVTYLDVIRTMWPIAAVGMGAAFARGFKQIMLEQDWEHRLFAVLVTCVPSAAFSVIGVLLLPLCMPESLTITPEIQVGIAGLLGGWGTKVFDIMMRRALKLSVVELSESESKETTHE